MLTGNNAVANIGISCCQCGTAGGAGREDDEYSGGSAGNNDVLLACSAHNNSVQLQPFLLYSVALELSLKIISFTHGIFVDFCGYVKNLTKT